MEVYLYRRALSFAYALFHQVNECYGACGCSADVGPHGDHERQRQANGHGNCEPYQLCSACALTVPIVQGLIKQTGTDESIRGA